MRLTLRTLLAYLDDQLSPSEAKEIGAKLQETPPARALADRAAEAIRRRRLGVPGDATAGGDTRAAAGPPALDPNEVAAYLDNALPPDRVAAVEQVCLADDAHLAEVAAGHQILAQALSEPVAVAPSLASRLVALAPAPDPSQGDPPAPEAAAPPPRPAHRSAPSVKAVPAAAAGGNFEEGLPDYLKQSRRGWGWLPWAAAAALAAGWLAVVLVDDDLFGPADGAVAVVDPNAAGLPPAAAEAAAGPGEPAAPVPAADPNEFAAAEPADAGPADADAEEAARSAATLPFDPPPPESAAAAETDEPAMTDAAGPAADPADAVVSAEGTADESTEPAAAPPAAAPPAAAVTLTEGAGLFAFDPARRGFYAVAEGGSVPPGVPLVVPEPLSAALSVAGAPVSVVLLGGTRATLAPRRVDGAAAALAVDAGRVLLSRAQPGDDGAAGVEVAAGGAVWTLTPAVGAAAAVAVEPRLPRGAAADLRGASARAAVAAVGGSVVAVDRGPGSDREPVELAAGTTAALVTNAGVLAAPGAATGDAAGLFADGVPPWATAAEETPADRLQVENFTAALLPDQPLSVSLPPLVEREEEILARQAAAAMALAGRSGDLARTLNRTPHPSVVTVAADGLRSLLGRNAESDVAVNTALEREFPPEARVLLGRLLDRLTDAEARDPEVSRQVVAALDRPELAVRTLAIGELERLTGVTKNYRPLDSASSRSGAVRRWNRELEQTGAILDPNGAPAEGGGGDADGPDPADAAGVNFDELIPDDL